MLAGLPAWMLKPSGSAKDLKWTRNSELDANYCRECGQVTRTSVDDSKNCKN